MFFAPLPMFIAEFFIFYMAVKEWGFFNTLGLYLLPCLLGFLIISTIGRLGLIGLQTTVMRGKLPANQILHSVAIFVSGILFLVPSFFTRVFALILLLPGLRHLAIWKFKSFIAKKISNGAFFNSGSGGFKFYSFGGEGSQDFSSPRREREVHSADVLDVTPLKVTHETNHTKPDTTES